MVFSEGRVEQKVQVCVLDHANRNCTQQMMASQQCRENRKLLFVVQRRRVGGDNSRSHSKITLSFNNVRFKDFRAKQKQEHKELFVRHGRQLFDVEE